MVKSEDSLIVKIAGKLDPSLASAVSSASKLISGANSAAQKVAGVGVKVAGMAAKAVAATGAAIATGAGASIKTAADFDSAMSQVAASMGTTVDQIPDIEAMAKKMGAETSFSAVQAAEGFNILAQAGLSANDQIAAIKPTLDLAAAGGIEMSDAASYVTGAVMGFGDSMDNASKYADMIALGATQVKTDVGSLGEAFSDASAVAKSFSQDQTTTIVTLERLANANITGSEAAQSMRRVMTRLYAPTASASKVLKKLGVSAYDTNGDARDLTDVLDDLQAATNKLPESQKNAYLNTVLGQQGLSAYSAITATTTDKVEELYKAMSHASDDGGSAAKQAATMLDNLSGDITIMQSALEGVAIAFGQQLTPYAREAVQWATGALSGITDIMNSDMSVADKISKVAGEVGGLGAQVVTEVTKHIPDVVSLASQVIAAFFSGIQQNWPTISQAAADTITYFVTGLGNHLPQVTEFAIQMLSTLVNAFTERDNLQQMTTAIAQGITGMINVIIAHLPEFADMGKEIFTQIINGIASSGDSAGGIINKIFVGLLAIGPVMKVLKPVGSVVGSIAGIFGKIPGLFGKLGSAASTVTAPVQAASGGLATLTANAKGIVALGAGIMMTGAGMYLLANAAISIANAGPSAAIAMAVMTAAVAGMAIGAAALAPALAAGSAGLIAFGAGVTLVGVGILAATAGVALLATQLPTIASYGSASATAILQISASLVGLAAGSVAAAAGITAMFLPMVGGAASIAAVDLAMVGFIATVGIGTAAMVLLEAQLLLVLESLKSIASNAASAGTSIQSMVDGIDVISTGLNTIESVAKDAIGKFVSIFQGASPDIGSAAQQMGASMTTPIQSAAKTAIAAFTGIATAAMTSAATIRAAFANMTITIPRPKLPHISVSYKTSGAGGASTKIPEFSVQYFAKGGIVNRPSLIGMNGSSGMIAGEEGPEAITPLSSLWKQMDNMASRTPANVTYSPQIIIHGNASRQDVIAANRMGMQEFRKMYEEMQRENNRRRL